MPRVVAERIIHKALLGPNGEAGAFCTTPPRVLDRSGEAWILSKWLHDEITCPDCRAKLGLKDEPSRGSLLRDNLAIRLNIAFQFIDANYWNRNVRKQGEPKLNPDEDAFLAATFIRLTREFDELLRPVLLMMEKHDDHFGWPEIIAKHDRWHSES